MHRKRNQDSIVFDAIEFAAQRHNGQMRKGTRIPYMVHLMNVAALLAERDCDAEVVAGGVLHDIVEDTPTPLALVFERFGERVGRIVEGTTEPEKLNKTAARGEKESWKERKQHTISFVRDDAEPDVLLVSCADKLDNITAIGKDLERLGDEIWERFNAPRESQSWYYRSLTAAFVVRAEEGTPLHDLAVRLRAGVARVFR